MSDIALRLVCYLVAFVIVGIIRAAIRLWWLWIPILIIFWIVQLFGRLWVYVAGLLGGISPAHWTAAGVGVAGMILVEGWKAWRGRIPRPLAGDDDDDFDDDPTYTRPVLRLVPPRLSREERRQAAIYAEIERKAKLSAAWEAWYSGRGPRPF